MTAESRIYAAVIDLVAPGAHLEVVQRLRSTPARSVARLRLTTDDGTLHCFLKTSADLGGLRQEAIALRALEDLAFAAPRVLAGPHAVPTAGGPVEVLVLSVLPGDVLPWIRVTDIQTVDRTCRLLIEAIDRLHALTPRVAALPAGADIPTRSLDDELAAAARRHSPWTDTTLVQEALEVLHERVPRARLPLVFSNGDYNPLNVLADDDGLTGWVDFEHAGFEDPLIGLPKFHFWSDDSGWAPAAQTGLVERYLYRRQVTPTAFLVRVALRGLTHLHDAGPDKPPVAMLNEIERAVAVLRRGG